MLAGLCLAGYAGSVKERTDPVYRDRTSLGVEYKDVLRHVAGHELTLGGLTNYREAYIARLFERESLLTRGAGVGDRASVGGSASQVEEGSRPAIT